MYLLAPYTKLQLQLMNDVFLEFTHIILLYTLVSLYYKQLKAPS